jgi:hypothetical protein
VVAAVAISLAAARAAGAQAPPVDVRAIALTGEPVPGMPGATWSSFRSATSVYNSGDMLFNGSLRHAQGTSSGLFRASPGGGIELVALSGQQAPGLSAGTTFGRLSPGAVNSAGEVYFLSDLAGPDVVYGDYPTSGASWLLSGGRLQLVARDGDPAAGTSQRFRYTSGVTKGEALTEGGNVLFRGELLPDMRSGVWYGRPQLNLRPVLLEGQPVAGLPGVSVGDVGNVHRSRGEQAVVYTALVGTGRKPDASNADAVFAGPSDNLRPVALVGAPAPGTGTTFQTLGAKINSGGKIALSSRLADGSYGLFVGPPSDLRPVLRTGDEAPGTGGQPFHGFIGAGHITDGGVLGVGGYVRVGSDVHWGLWAGPPDALRLVALNGQRAPGTGEGTFIRLINNLLMNDNGLVVFHSPLEGPGARGPGDYGIFGTDPTGQLHLVARKGDLFQVGPDDLRTIDGPAGGEFQYVSNFNDANTFALALRFTNGSEGVFAFRIVPEPNSLLILSPGLAALVRRRLRQPDFALESQ